MLLIAPDAAAPTPHRPSETPTQIASTVAIFLNGLRSTSGLSKVSHFHFLPLNNVHVPARTQRYSSLKWIILIDGILFVKQPLHPVRLL